jgi:hypothetical protein
MKKVCATLFAATVMAALGLQGSATAAPAGATGWPTGCAYSKKQPGGRTVGRPHAIRAMADTTRRP